MATRLTLVSCMISAMLALSAGCAISSRQHDQGRDHNASFMEAWRAYSHCLSSKEPEAIVSDLHALKQFAEGVSTSNHKRTFGIIPYTLPPLPVRLAVDPAAMVTACAEHGANVALSLEQPKGSAELLITSVEAKNYSKKSLD